MSFNKIAVIGLGYIGLPTATVFALSGKQVIGVDVNSQVVATINQGNIHIVEPNLAEKVAQVVAQGYLTASSQPQPADAFLIAVPTPFQADHQPDLRYVKAAALAIAPVLQAGNVVILESTSPVGATEQMVAWLAQARPDLRFPQPEQQGEIDIHVAYCPERVLPGNVLQELVANDRVIGGITPACSAKASALYQLFVKGQCIATSARTAEMCKLTENSFRDVNIAFANELSMICQQQGINVWELIALANRHPRVNILQPGPGVGGHCIAVDPWFIVAQSPELAKLIATARRVNDSKPAWVIEQVKQAVGECLQQTNQRASDITLACLGLTFKADIDDLRESPALAISQQLAEWHQGKTLLVEPNIDQLPSVLADSEAVARVALVPLSTALAQAAVIVILVDHQSFKAVQYQHLINKKVIDCKGVWQ